MAVSYLTSGDTDYPTAGFFGIDPVREKESVIFSWLSDKLSIIDAVVSESSPTATFTRNTSKTFSDNEGVTTLAEAGEYVSPGSRRLRNLLTISSAPATQDVTLGPGVYLLQVQGTGSATSSAGTATITGGGAATSGTPNTFTVTAYGTVTITVAGTLTQFSCYNVTGAGNTTSEREFVDSATDYGAGIVGCQYFNTNLDGTLIAASSRKGFDFAPQRTNVVTGYNVLGPDKLGSELSSGNLSLGKRYKITARTDADFTADGAADNNVDTEFTATGTSVTLDAGDKVKEIGMEDTSGNFVSGGGTGAKITRVSGVWGTALSAIGITATGGSDGDIIEVVDETANMPALLSRIIPSKKGIKVTSSNDSFSTYAIISGQFGQTSLKQSTHCYARVTGGTGRLTDTTAATFETFTNTLYSKITRIITPTNSTDRMVIGARGVGQSMFFLLPQNEVGNSAGPSIIVQGVSATRTADALSIPFVNGQNMRDSQGMLFVDATMNFAAANIPAGTTMNVLAWNNGAIQYIKTAGSQNQIAITDGTNTSTVNIASFTSGTTFKIGGRWNSLLDELQISVDGSAGSATSYADSFGASTLNVGTGNTFTEQMQIKNIKCLRNDKGANFSNYYTT